MATTGKHTNGKTGSRVSKGKVTPKGGRTQASMTKKGLGMKPIHGSGAASIPHRGSRNV